MSNKNLTESENKKEYCFNYKQSNFMFKRNLNRKKYRFNIVILRRGSKGSDLWFHCQWCIRYSQSEVWRHREDYSDNKANQFPPLNFRSCKQHNCINSVIFRRMKGKMFWFVTRDKFQNTEQIKYCSVIYWILRQLTFNFTHT